MWEYKFVPFIDDPETGRFTTELEFNELGGQDWELVTIYQHWAVEGFDINNNDIQQLPVGIVDNQVAIFKRRK